MDDAWAADASYIQTTEAEVIGPVFELRMGRLNDYVRREAAGCQLHDYIARELDARDAPHVRSAPIIAEDPAIAASILQVSVDHRPVRYADRTGQFNGYLQLGEDCVQLPDGTRQVRLLRLGVCALDGVTTHAFQRGDLAYADQMLRGQLEERGDGGLLRQFLGSPRSDNTTARREAEQRDWLTWLERTRQAAGLPPATRRFVGSALYGHQG